MTVVTKLCFYGSIPSFKPSLGDVVCPVPNSAQFIAFSNKEARRINLNYT